MNMKLLKIWQRSFYMKNMIPRDDDSDGGNVCKEGASGTASDGDKIVHCSTISTEQCPLFLIQPPILHTSAILCSRKIAFFYDTG